MRALVLLAVTGCWHVDGAPPPGPPARRDPPPKPYDQLEAKMPLLLASFDGLTEALDNAGTRCDLMGAVLRRWGLDMRPQLDELAALKAALTADERDHFDFEHADDAARMHAPLDVALASCADDAEVEAALDLAGFRTSVAHIAPPKHKRASRLARCPRRSPERRPNSRVTRTSSP